MTESSYAAHGHQDGRLIKMVKLNLNFRKFPAIEVSSVDPLE
jgi:hypothetical protein